ncbi:DUF6894 family protein [Mesorhizobium sp. AR07]|uniref:DUF6894 family protein n=1 Tax=Mesorhizobium sp. AR07 TaxID=2865838 RepID=UPI0039B6F66B
MFGLFVLCFFDFCDTGESFPDGEGIELHSIESARNEPMKALIEIASEILPEGSFRGALRIEVRDDSRQELFRVPITLQIHPEN